LASSHGIVATSIFQTTKWARPTYSSYNASGAICVHYSHDDVTGWQIFNNFTGTCDYCLYNYSDVFVIQVVDGWTNYTPGYI